MTGTEPRVVSREADFVVVGEKAALGPLRPDLAGDYARYDRRDAVPVGTAGLFGIVHAHARAELAIVIGERRGQGLGTAATRLVLDFGFNVRQLRNVMLETLAWNVAALTAYERAGFRRIGVRRGAVVSRGRPTDMVIMDAVPEDFGDSVLS